MLKAVIFDLNGTVLADEYVYGGAFRKVLAYLGRKVDKNYPHIGGIGVEENWPRLISKYHIKTFHPYKELARMTQDAYLKNFTKVTLRSGFPEFVSALREKGIKTALATSNTWWVVDKVFEKLNLAGYFDSVTTKEEVPFNKPSPDIFLTAAKKIDVKPENCLVFEDSEAGIEAAKAADMKVVALAKNKEEERNYKKIADLVINSFKKVSLSRLELL
jgi:HAD superfamily hydrolase (TIGR01509 family)